MEKDETCTEKVAQALGTVPIGTGPPVLSVDQLDEMFKATIPMYSEFAVPIIKNVMKQIGKYMGDNSRMMMVKCDHFKTWANTHREYVL